MVGVFATSHYTKSHLHKTHESNYVDEEKIGKTKNHLHLHTHAIHGHAHDSVSMLERSDSAQLHRLQICIGMAHSMIIGISLGASESPKAIKPLVAALTFHQFFEGMGLGGCISQVIHACVLNFNFFFFIPCTILCHDLALNDFPKIKFQGRAIAVMGLRFRAGFIGIGDNLGRSINRFSVQGSHR
ncbi:hypothetical protein Gotri_023199 [Gossypium trilobum]|uniref:Uncharacterized protein n=1 Tax=Gossypium trilobum TaxID=34281 RepID=A0A7J9DIS4_9ROSI|nr:hypothetical protein [Gossypium trilobum]